jgi:VanZ family protein
MRSALRYYLPAILWTAIVLASSTDVFSSVHTFHWLVELLRDLFGRQPPEQRVQVINFFWRKATHVVAYGLVGALWFRALRSDSAVRWTARWSWQAIGLTAFFASVDEIHQIFVPSRTASVFDVLLDVGGASLAVVLIRVSQVLLFRA